MGKLTVSERAQRRQFWEEHFGKWKASGLTQAEYCRKENLRIHSFWYWRKRVHPEKESATLVEIKRPLPGTFIKICTPLCLVFSGRFRIEIEDGFDPAVLKQLICTLSEL